MQMQRCGIIFWSSNRQCCFFEFCAHGIDSNP